MDIRSWTDNGELSTKGVEGGRTGLKMGCIWVVGIGGNWLVGGCRPGWGCICNGC